MNDMNDKQWVSLDDVELIRFETVDMFVDLIYEIAHGPAQKGRMESIQANSSALKTIWTKYRQGKAVFVEAK